MKKIRQHHVFRHYLTAWADDEQIWALRNGKIFRPNVANVAVEREFYRLQDLTLDDIALVKAIAIDSSPKHLQPRCAEFVEMFFLPVEARRRIDPVAPADAEMRAYLDELIVNLEEDFHAQIEATLIPSLKEMLEGSVAFYADDERAAQFLHAICLQYVRTKKIREGLRTLRKTPVPGSDIGRAGNLLSQIFALNMGWSLYRDRARFKIQLVDNDSHVPFIAGDQPIINLHGGGDGVPERLEFFYPLSPKKAMFLFEASTPNNSKLDGDEVKRLNALMVQNSHEWLFSNSSEYLETLMDNGTQEKTLG